MEWSRSSREISKEESEELELVVAPTEETIQLHERIGISELKFKSLSDHKQTLIRDLNAINDSTAISKANCEGLEDICEKIRDRLSETRIQITTGKRTCEELQTRIQRDANLIIVGKVSELLEQQASESIISDFVYKELAENTDPDDLLARLNGYYDTSHRRVKEAVRQIAQLKTSVHSLKKDEEEAQIRLTMIERSKQAKKPITQDNIPKVSIIDRKVAPTKPILVLPSSGGRSRLGDDLAPPRKRREVSEFGKMFN